MSDGTVVALARGTAAIGGTLAVIGSALLIAMGQAAIWWSGLYAFLMLLSIFFAVFVWLVVPQQPRNAVVWTMAASAFFGGVYVAGVAFVALLVDDLSLVLSETATSTVIPAHLPQWAAWTLGVVVPASFLAIFPQLTFGLLLFPDGTLPSPRWRWVGVLAGISIVLATAGDAWSFRPGNSGRAETGLLLDIAIVLLVLAVMLSLAALIGRFRRSTGMTRRQFMWVVWGASIFIFAIVGAIALGDVLEDAIVAPFMVATAIFLGSYGVAVGRYQLFDIDVVISRTVVVAGLAGFITVVYAALVLGVGLLLGDLTDAALPLVIAATVVVAIAFQPLRTRMRRWADRLVYGERATPYEVLSHFSERMRATVATEELIPQLAQLLTQGTGARRATVWMKTGDELRPVASWPEEAIAAASVGEDGGEPSIPGVDHLAPVEHDGELLGAVTVTMPRAETLTTSEERLVDDVASQAGLVLRNARLTADLVDTIKQLRRSRQRLVAAQDEERRRLERDLHDGAQQQIIAIKMKVAAAQQLTERGDDSRAAELLQQVLADTDDAVDSLRDLAHGIYPPLLEAEGLGAALRARTAKAPIPVSVTANGIGRYSPEIEAAVYFCVLEAAQNAVKYAEAARVGVTVEQEDGRLIFEVADNGNGFDPASESRGRGLVNMADRLDALGGSLDVRSAPGAGTTIVGILTATPIVSEASADRMDAAAKVPTVEPTPT